MQGMRSNVLLLCTLLLNLVTGPVGCDRGPRVRIHTGDGKSIDVTVELAVSAEARMRGLMYRTHLASDAGMLFVFPESGEHGFWMKNTPLSLDMIFISSDLEIVGLVEKTTPFSPTVLNIGRPSRYVLEVNAGFSKQHHVSQGNRVELVQVPATVS